MPPLLAATIYLSGVAWLLRRDIRQRPEVTSAIWIPTIWMFIIMSRFVTAWLAMFGIHVGGSSVEEGSLVDALGSLVLIILGVRVLMRRGMQFSEVVRHNQWVVIFFMWCFLSILWSDNPFVSLKRWIKVMGHPVMVLVLLTEPDFETAITVLFRRLTYVIVIVSILFIKYFPEYGRGFSAWTGQPFNQGITLDKNALGADCLILWFFLFWYTLKVLKWEKGRLRRVELMICAGLLFLTGWLMNQAQSSTSLVSCVLGMVLVLFLGFRWVRKEMIGTYLLAALGVGAFAWYVLGFSDVFFQMLGKNSTLTDRTQVWQDCLSVPINPIIGVGFENFWMGARQEYMNSLWRTWHPNEAHNGYLETYLNLGLIGVFILVAMLFSTFWKARRELILNFHLGRFRMAFFISTLFYNVTESGFKALHPMWFMFCVIALDYPRPAPVTPTPAIVETDDPAEAEELLGNLPDDRQN